MNTIESLRKVPGTKLGIFTAENTSGHTTKDGWVVPPEPTNIIDLSKDEFLLEYSDHASPGRCLWLSVVGRKSDIPLPIGAHMNPQVLHPAKRGLFRKIITPQLISKAGTLFGTETKGIGFLFAIELGFESWEEVFANWMDTEVNHGKKSIADFVRQRGGDQDSSVFAENSGLHRSVFGETHKALHFSLILHCMYMKGIIDLGTLGTVKSNIQRGPNLIFSGTLGVGSGPSHIYTLECGEKPHLLSIAGGLERTFAYVVE